MLDFLGHYLDKLKNEPIAGDLDVFSHASSIEAPTEDIIFLTEVLKELFFFFFFLSLCSQVDFTSILKGSINMDNHSDIHSMSI